eukprot:scaffold32627_cov124-Isochrysis_galbana.AAC.3
MPVLRPLRIGRRRMPCLAQWRGHAHRVASHQPRPLWGLAGPPLLHDIATPPPRVMTAYAPTPTTATPAAPRTYGFVATFVTNGSSGGGGGRCGGLKGGGGPGEGGGGDVHIDESTCMPLTKQGGGSGDAAEGSTTSEPVARATITNISTLRSAILFRGRTWLGGCPR